MRKIEPMTVPVLKSSSSGGGGSGVFSNVGLQQKEAKALNAKKLDIDFDNDDFFNSFAPSESKDKPVEVKKNTA